MEININNKIFTKIYVRQKSVSMAMKTWLRKTDEAIWEPPPPFN